MMRFIAILLALAATTAKGFTCASGPQRHYNTDAFVLSALSRSQFLTAAVSSSAAAMLVVTSPALAADDAAKKGTKDDPAYQFCLSTCMYECTKPKGEETKLRKECLPECKQKCATTKQQLMVGTPMVK